MKRTMATLVAAGVVAAFAGSAQANDLEIFGKISQQCDATWSSSSSETVNLQELYEQETASFTVNCNVEGFDLTLDGGTHLLADGSVNTTLFDDSILYLVRVGDESGCPITGDTLGALPKTYSSNSINAATTSNSAVCDLWVDLDGTGNGPPNPQPGLMYKDTITVSVAF